MSMTEVQLCPTDFVVIKILETINTPVMIGKIVIVPAPYVTFDEALNSIVAKYLLPPYKKEDILLLDNLIKTSAPAPQDWPLIKSTILGYASTYLLAQIEMKKIIAAQEEMVLNSLMNVPDMEKVHDEEEIQAEQKDSVPPAKMNTPRVDGEVTIDSPIDIIKITDIIKAQIESSIRTTFSEHFNPLKSKLNVIDRKVSDLTLIMENVLERLDNEPVHAKNVMTLTKLVTKNKHLTFSFPLKSLQEFERFNQLLESNEALKSDFEKYVHSSTSVNKEACFSLNQMIKDLCHPHVLEKFTAQKKMKCKLIIAETLFFKCIEAPMLEKYAGVTNGTVDSKLIKKAMGTVINNSYDWVGGIKKRISKKLKDSNSETSPAIQTASNINSEDGTSDMSIEEALDDQ